MGLFPFTGKQPLHGCEVIRGDAFYPRHNILHPFSRIDICLVAGGNEGVDHSSTIGSIMIVAVTVVVQTDHQRPYDFLDVVIVRPEAAIIYVPCQLGHMREGIVHCLGHWRFLGIYSDLGIKPSLKVLDYRICFLLSFLLSLFKTDPGNIRIVFNGVQLVDGCNGGFRRRLISPRPFSSYETI